MLKHRTFGPWFQTTRCWQQTNCCDAYAVSYGNSRLPILCPVTFDSSLTEKKINKIVKKCKTYRGLLVVCCVLLVYYIIVHHQIQIRKYTCTVYKIQKILLSVNSTGMLHISDNLEPSLATNYTEFYACILLSHNSAVFNVILFREGDRHNLHPLLKRE